MRQPSLTYKWEGKRIAKFVFVLFMALGFRTSYSQSDSSLVTKDSIAVSSDTLVNTPDSLSNQESLQSDTTANVNYDSLRTLDSLKMMEMYMAQFKDDSVEFMHLTERKFRELYITRNTPRLKEDHWLEMIRNCGIFESGVPIYDSKGEIVNWDSLAAEKFLHDRITGSKQNITANDQRELTFKEYLFGLENEWNYKFGILYVEKESGQKIPLYFRFYFPLGKNLYMKFKDVANHISGASNTVRKEFFDGIPEESINTIKEFAQYDRDLLKTGTTVKGDVYMLRKRNKWGKLMAFDSTGMYKIEKYRWKKHLKNVASSNIDIKNFKLKPKSIIWDVKRLLSDTSKPFTYVDIDSNQTLQQKHESSLKVDMFDWGDIFDTPTEVEFGVTYVEKDLFHMPVDTSYAISAAKGHNRLNETEINSYKIVSEYYLNMDADTNAKTNFRFLISDLKNKNYKKQGEDIVFKTGEKVYEKDIYIRLIYKYLFRNGVFEKQELYRVDVLQSARSPFNKSGEMLEIGRLTPQQFYHSCEKHELKRVLKRVKKGLKKPAVVKYVDRIYEIGQSVEF